MLAEKDLPAVVTFVAPTYPWAARYQRIMGKTVTRVTVNRDGVRRKDRPAVPCEI
jgi:hypothetical protein